MLLMIGTVRSTPLHAGPIDPRLQFRYVDTPHFRIYFHQDEERLAGHLAAIAEDVRTRIGASLQTTLPAYTHVIIADQSEFANGFATPLPRNTILLNASAPSGSEFIGNADDWLRVLFTHEYTHIVHLDRSHGWSAIARGLFGRAPFVFPNLTVPQWQIEGLAAWQESASTGFGRATAGDFRAIETTAAAAGHPLRLDQASGGLVGWPDGHAPYAAGLGFHEYLAGRFGAESLGRLADATAGRLPYLGTRAFRRVYGESLSSLWSGYSDEVARRAASLPSASTATPLTHFRSAVVSGPRFAPGTCVECAATIVYSVESADAFPALREVHQDGTNDTRLSTRFLGATAGATETTVVFDQLDVHRAVGMYADLYALDRGTGDVRRLTHEARLQDPDIAPDGRRIVATQQHGDRRDLVIVEMAASTEERGNGPDITVLASEAFTSFSTPRWSPSGKLIAAERRPAGALPEVVVIDPASGRVVATLASAMARIVTPTWLPDERAVVAAADFNGQPFDLYEFSLDSPHRMRRLTRSAGAIWPDVRRDGQMLAYAGYTAAGFALFTTPYAPLADDDTAQARLISPDSEAPVATALASVATADARPYSPLATLGPTSWTPVLYDVPDGTRVGGAASGADILGRHAYGVEATWLVQRPTVERAAPRTADWSASYAYTRFQPTFFVSASSTTSTVVVSSPATHAATNVAMTERQAQAGVSLPVPHVLHRTQWLASLLRTERRYLFASEDRTVRLAFARFALAHSTAQQYGYSISPERGFTIGTTLEAATHALGSQSNAATATIDARLYAPAFRPHHVIALRAASGISNGAALARQSFRLGATAASTSVIDFGSDALGLLRGVSGSTIAGRQIIVGNGEYRLPLLRVERGHGTWPLFVRFVHAALFADAGRVRGIEGTSTQWRHAEGAELSVDGVAGYGLPFTISVGTAWTHDADTGRGPAAYVRFGRSF